VQAATRLRRHFVSPLSAAFVHPSLILGVYILIGCWNLRQPGLEYDEVLFANAALGHLDESFIAYELDLGGIRVPLMLMTYIGALKAYIYGPIFELFPTTPLTVRLPVIIIGMITLVVTYRLLIRLVDRRVALSVCWLLATDPSFVFHTRIDFGPTVLMMFLKMTSLLAFVHFVKSGGIVWLALGSFLVGLGVFDKANFLWYIVGLVTATLVVWRKGVSRYLTVRSLVVCGFFMFLGSFPFIYYNLATNGRTFQERVLLPQDIVGSAKARTGLLTESLSGSGVYKFVNGRKPSGFVEALTSVWPATITPWVLACTVVFSCVARGTLRSKPADQLGVFFTLLFLAIVVQIYLTRLAVGWHHFMMLWPFHQIALCIFLLRSGSTRCSVVIGSADSIRSKIGRKLPVIALVSMTASNLVVDSIYLRSFSTEGGRGFFSDAIYELAEYAMETQGRRFLLMDWGFNTQLLLLSRGSIEKDEIFWRLETSDGDDMIMERLYKRAIQPNTFLVFHATPFIVHDRPRELFDKMLRRFALQTEIVKVFFHKRGDPVYLLVKVTAS